MILLQRPKIFLLTNVILGEVFPVMECLSTYNVARWRYLQLKNLIFFFFGIVA